MARLPTPGKDEGIWGGILNDYLSQIHNSDGSLKDNVVTSSQLAPNAVDSTALADDIVSVGTIATPASPTAGQVLGYDGSGLTWSTPTGSGSIPDADTTTKGVVQLAGDLSGTATAPTVPGLATKEPSVAAGTTTQYYRGDKTWQALNKTAVGLAEVDNTSDANKPVSTATQAALDDKAAAATTVSAGAGLTGGGDLSANRTLAVSFGTASGTAAQGNDSRITGAEQTVNKGAANGYASLDANSRIPTAQLGSGTASNATFLRGDNTWAAVGSSGLNATAPLVYDSGTNTVSAPDVLVVLKWDSTEQNYEPVALQSTPNPKLFIGRYRGGLDPATIAGITLNRDDRWR